MSFWKSACRAVRCCVKTAGKIDDVLDEIDSADSADKTAVNVAVNVNAPASPAPAPAPDATVLVDRSELAKNPNGAISITIGNVTVAPGGNFSLNTGEEDKRKSTEYQEVNHQIDTELFLRQLILSTRNKEEFSLSEVIATPNTKHKFPVSCSKTNHFFISPRGGDMLSESQDGAELTGDITEVMVDAL